VSELFFALLEIAVKLRCPPRTSEWWHATRPLPYEYERVKWQEYARAVKPS